MWFEVLPSFSICVACLAIPSYLPAITNKLALGNMYLRDLKTNRQMLTVLRDERLTGSAYKTLGLESIPDAPKKN